MILTSKTANFEILVHCDDEDDMRQNIYIHEFLKYLE